jgi:hypothetical protein
MFFRFSGHRRNSPLIVLSPTRRNIVADGLGTVTSTVDSSTLSNLYYPHRNRKRQALKEAENSLSKVTQKPDAVSFASLYFSLPGSSRPSRCSLDMPLMMERPCLGLLLHDKS